MSCSTIANTSMPSLLDLGQQRRHLRNAQRRFDHRAELDRLTERQVLGFHLRPNLGIDLLEVQVTDALRCAADDRDVVAAAVADVAGVQAEVDELAVGAVEEAVDVLLGVDVAVGMWMVLRTDAVLLEHRLAEFVHALGLLAPLLGREVAVLEHGAGGRVAPHLGDDDHVLAADGRGQPCRRPRSASTRHPTSCPDAGARRPCPRTA